MPLASPRTSELRLRLAPNINLLASVRSAIGVNEPPCERDTVVFTAITPQFSKNEISGPVIIDSAGKIQSEYIESRW